MCDDQITVFGVCIVEGIQAMIGQERGSQHMARRRVW